MQGVVGFDGLISIRSRFPRVPILVVSGLEDPRIMREALRHGAAGFVPKAVDKATLTRAIADVLGGGLSIPAALSGPAADLATPATQLAERIARLTPQQLRVLLMIRQGKLNKQIAFDLSIADATVKAHVTAIMRKLGVQSRTQAVLIAREVNFATILHD